MAGAVDLSALKQRPAAPAEGGAGGKPNGVEITEANLEDEVLVRSSQMPVVVLLWSPRSDASAQLGNALAELAQADGGKWSLATVNVDAVPRVAQMFGVQAVPTVVALAAGRDRVQMGRRGVVAGTAGEHRATVQCDLSHICR